MYDSKYIQTDDNNLHMKKLISFNRRLNHEEYFKIILFKKVQTRRRGFRCSQPRKHGLG